MLAVAFLFLNNVVAQNICPGVNSTSHVFLDSSSQVAFLFRVQSGQPFIEWSDLHYAVNNKPFDIRRMEESVLLASTGQEFKYSATAANDILTIGKFVLFCQDLYNINFIPF